MPPSNYPIHPSQQGRPFSLPLTLSFLLLLTLLSLPSSLAHDHHADTPLPPTGDPTPVDWILKAHITVMSLAYIGFLPVGIILGLVKHRLHVPIQAIGTGLIALGYILGHSHGGRRFEESAHSANAWIMLYALMAQVGLGVVLKLYRDPTSKLRSSLRIAHSLLGLAHPVLAYIQIVFGAITWNAFCAADHKGNCLAHFIMGSSFAWYGVFCLWAVSRLGRAWLGARGIRSLSSSDVSSFIPLSPTGGGLPSPDEEDLGGGEDPGLGRDGLSSPPPSSYRSLEYYEAWLIAAWGLVNSLTEHRWGSTWFHNDIQHTAMGILWLVGGIASILLTHHRPSLRSPIPAIIILLTGVAMASHAQHSMIGTMVHGFFGKAIGLAAVFRLIEVIIDRGGRVSSQIRPLIALKFLSSLFLILGGFLFSSSQEEALAFVDHSILDAASYMLLVTCLAFAVYAYAQGLILLCQHLAPDHWVGLASSLPRSAQYGRLRGEGHGPDTAPLSSSHHPPGHTGIPTTPGGPYAMEPDTPGTRGDESLFDVHHYTDEEDFPEGQEHVELKTVA